MAKNNNSKEQSQSTDIYSILQSIIEVILLFVKLFYTLIESLIKLFVSTKTDVKGNVVFITGTGHGIGKETALQYAALGAKVICVDITEKQNVQTVSEIKKAGGQAFAYTCDVTNREAINELAKTVRDKFDFVDIIVNNAGIMPCHPLLKHTETEIRKMFEVNVMAHFWIIQAFLPSMMERNEGHIVALSSCAGLFGLPNLVPYCGTKFAVRGIMESFAEELRHYNSNNRIKLTTIYPYMVDTGLCKKPRFRFSFMKMVNPKDAAESIISAQRDGIEHATIPRHFLYLEKFGKTFPKGFLRAINDFMDSGVDSDI